MKNDWNNLIERKWKKKLEEQFSINQILNDEIKIIYFKKISKKNQFELTFEIGDFSLEPGINLIVTKKK